MRQYYEMAKIDFKWKKDYGPLTPKAKGDKKRAEAVAKALRYVHVECTTACCVDLGQFSTRVKGPNLRRCSLSQSEWSAAGPFCVAAWWTTSQSQNPPIGYVCLHLNGSIDSWCGWVIMCVR